MEEKRSVEDMEIAYCVLCPQCEMPLLTVWMEHAGASGLTALGTTYSVCDPCGSVVKVAWPDEETGETRALGE